MQIRSALLSVFHKEGLDQIVNNLHRLGVRLLATGGTFDFIKAMNIPVIPVEDITGYPSILDGRVKTLHPAVFGGILAVRDEKVHQQEMKEHKLDFIDLVVVDLYPFESTVASGASKADIIEKIDIGGISLIRAAGKNFQDVLIIPSQEDYALLNTILAEQKGIPTNEQLSQQAFRAFEVSSRYDHAIMNWMGGNERRSLRYGENPHQQAYFEGNLPAVFDQLHGKELSYNNILDIDAALGLISEFTEPTFAVIKHNNACGIASAKDVVTAWDKALAGDPVSAFGGVLVVNRPVDAAAAEKINSLFFEILMAPGFEAEALTILKSKKNRILLQTKQFRKPVQTERTILNGKLVQDADIHKEEANDMKVVTEKSPSANELSDLEFANIIVKHSKSNAIVLAKNKQLCASGVGQTSRVDALKQAIAKAEHFGFSLGGAVMASDAFFPFPDCVQIAAAAGITAVVQPGGSLKDQDSIDECNRNGIAMTVTGYRHFRH